jgi:hypothetical protein
VRLSRSSSQSEMVMKAVNLLYLPALYAPVFHARERDAGYVFAGRIWRLLCCMDMPVQRTSLQRNQMRAEISSKFSPSTQLPRQPSVAIYRKYLSNLSREEEIDLNCCLEDHHRGHRTKLPVSQSVSSSQDHPGPATDGNCLVLYTAYESSSGRSNA